MYRSAIAPLVALALLGGSPGALSEVTTVDAGPSAGRRTMRTPREESEEVMNFLVQAASHLLSKNGEFYPLGAVMEPDGKLVATAVYEGDEHPPSQKVIDSLTEVFRAQAQQKKVKATGLAYDTLTIPPGAKDKVDAIAVRLDHMSGESLIVYFPYRLLPTREVVLMTSFATKGPGDIFR